MKSLGIAGGTVSTFLPLVVYVVMTLVMCPNILSGRNFKDENDIYAANLDRMFHPESYQGKDKVHPVSSGYEKSHDMLDEKSMNSVRSFRSYRSNDALDERNGTLQDIA